MLKFKKGDLSTAFITIVSVFMITIIFFQNIMLNLEVEKYNTINQYARDALLICETQHEIKASDLASVRKALANKVLKDGEYLDFTVQIGNNTPVTITNTSTGTFKPLYGQQIKITIVYYYNPFRFVSLDNSFFVKRSEATTIKADMANMGVSLVTISKAREV